MRFIVLLSANIILFAAVGLLHGSNISALADIDVANHSSRYVGSAVCAGCHAGEVTAWTASQHAHAMQDATEKTVLGDFNGAKAEHFSSKARFYRRDGQFFVETEGKDGKTAEFAVKYTFGIAPLQQYLVAFPDGRIQALPYAWDTRPKGEGGQRWFHLFPAEDIPPSDALHWTGPQQNWNYMCAECHSTGVRKNYDAGKNSFATSISEISVGCEACHGPGSGHVEWARKGRPANVAHRGFDSAPALRPAVRWEADAKTGSPAVASINPSGGVNETCDRCHSRRGQFSEKWRPGEPLANSHMPVLLTGDLFEDDGQMKDEVFNTSSFQQSKMFAKGVTCVNCHDPHSGKLRAEKSEVCSQCHAPGKFATSAHSGHASGPGAPDCISCHMPVRTYMVVDRRHDHSFRIPRPDLTVKIGAPNACAACHADRDAAWAAAAIERWHGPERKGFQTYALAFHAARLDLPEARELLLKVAQDASTPAIARATALFHLRDRPSASAQAEIEHGLRESDPLMRIAALRALEPQPLDTRWALAKASLADPIQAVRLQAASILADMPESDMGAEDKAAFQRASEEYIEAARLNADRGEERSNLAGFYARRGKPALAEEEYKAAIRLAPRQVPPRVNLADLYRALGRDGDAETLLRQTILDLPDASAAHHALGLTLIREKKYAEAIESLKRAADLEPGQPRYAYVYAIALQSAGRAEEAREILERALSSNPSSVEVLTALLQDALKRREFKAALPYAERLHALRPEDQGLARLRDRLLAVK